MTLSTPTPRTLAPGVASGRRSGPRVRLLRSVMRIATALLTDALRRLNDCVTPVEVPIVTQPNGPAEQGRAEQRLPPGTRSDRRRAARRPSHRRHQRNNGGVVHGDGQLAGTTQGDEGVSRFLEDVAKSVRGSRMLVGAPGCLGSGLVCRDPIDPPHILYGRHRDPLDDAAIEQQGNAGVRTGSYLSGRLYVPSTLLINGPAKSAPVTFS